MTGSGRFALASGSNTEGSSLTSTFTNGQRGSYLGANLDKSVSFRDGAENRILSSGSSSSRGSTTLSIDMPPLSQCMMLEPITLGDQKFTRSGELRRIFGVSVGNTSDDHNFGATHYKPPPPIASEEIKRFKASLLDTNTKSRDRVKKFQESISKLDKYRHTFNSRKRRAELSSSERSGGANPMKIGNQIQQNPLELVNQRLDKNVGLNKRVRTSVAESEARNIVLSRQTVMMDKDRDMLKGSSGSSVQDEQKTRGMPAGGDGWDRKMKRKRSVGAVINRSVDSDQEPKRAMHQKLSNDPRSRSLDANSFGPGPSNGVSGINKLDGTPQLTSSNARTVPKIELENVSLSNDRRERAFGSDKERVVGKANNKLNILESNQVGNQSTVAKGKASRALRTGSGLTSSSPNVPRTPGTLDGWEQPSCLNKIQSLSGVNNLKRPIATGPPSSPVAQWVGQRQQKNSRTRRANLVSPISNHGEVQTLPEGYPTSDIGAKLTSSETIGSQLPKGVSNRTQQYKIKLENISSPARFSESEESGAGENKLKEKHVDHEDMEDRSVNAVKKVGPFISSMKKNKVLIKDDTEDGVRRQGRSGRSPSLSRASVPPVREKLDSPAKLKPMRSMKTGFDKNGSKSGRPPSKKLSDRKGFTRPGSALNSGSSGFTGESDDDHEELLAAAESARNASYLACSGSFWKKVEPIFASVSSEDTTYLRKQFRFVEELDELLCNVSGSDLHVLGEVGCKEEPVSQPISYGERLGSIMNGIGSNILGRNAGSVNQLQELDTFCGKLDTEIRLQKITPLYQRVLSALVGEDEIDDLDHVSEGPESFQYASDDSPCVTFSHTDADCKDGDTMDSDLDSEVHPRIQRLCYLDNFSYDKKSAISIPNSLHNNGEMWQADGDLMQSDIGTTSVFGENHSDGSPSCTHSSTVSSSDCQYELMCLDEKLTLELQSIGLYPERVPDLAEGGEEEINKDIHELKKGLYGKVGKKRRKLSKIDKALLKGREVEGREIEQVAMNRLVEMAYKKRLACRGGNFSRSGVSRVSKVAALAFVKRTIARCRKFEDSGRSCFSEPAIQQVILSAPPYRNNQTLVDNVRDEAAANTHAGAQLESRASGLISTTVERQGPHGVKFDRGLSNSFQPLGHSSDQGFVQHEPISNRGKKREVLLEDVGNAVLRAIPVLGNILPGGAKGRRSERDRDQNKETSTSNSVAKTGRPSLGSFGAERKTKPKPKQKIAQLSTSGNGLLQRVRETTEPVYRPVRDGNRTVINNNNKVSRGVDLPPSKAPPNTTSKETEEPLFANSHLNELDSVEELGVPNDLGGPHDLCSWLNFDEDGLQDHDSMGLEIPMDDLSDLQMII